MTDSPLALLIQNTYVRSHLVYRISLLGEFFDFVFFTDNDSTPDKDAINRFANQEEESSQDIDFLKELPQSFMETFTRDSFRETLHSMSEKLQQLPLLSLTVPVKFPFEQTDMLGKWARKEIDQSVLLDVSVDAEVSVGCRFVWKDVAYDFSLEHYRHLHEEELRTHLKLSTPLEAHA